MRNEKKKLMKECVAVFRRRLCTVAFEGGKYGGYYEVVQLAGSTLHQNEVVVEERI